MLKRISFVFAIIGVAFFSIAQAEPGEGLEISDGLFVKMHGYGYLEAGQIGHGNLSYKAQQDIVNGGDNFINHLWTEDGYVSLGFDAVYKDNLEMVASLGTQLYFSYPQINVSGSRFTKNVRQDVAIDDAFTQFHFGDTSSSLFIAQIGYFKFKYNPDVRNLGEYMFRTGTYPVFFNMSFDFPQARLLGLHLQENLFESLKLDALLVSSTIAPTQDWSIAGLANYDVAKLHFINIGAGIDFANILNVYNNSSFSRGFGINGIGDPTTPRAGNAFFIDNGDTNYYTFTGTKLMGRISLDPKVFLPWRTMLGEDDLKLYAEADIIGVKNYPDSAYASSSATTKSLVAPSYDKWWQRMPISVGFNLPTFKTMDVLNAEVEWFGAKYYNDASNVITYGSAPLPWDWQDKTNIHYVKSEIKWSVYAKKSLFDGHFSIIGQVGRDHLRLPCALYDSESWAELLVTSSDWWWTLKTNWSF
jgi:hypothetical protein